MIATGFLIAYDYAFLYHSLPLVYDASDKIVLTIDKERKTLAGEPFEVDPDFFSWIRTIDTARKIEWVEQPFFEPGMQPVEIIIRMRNTMLTAMAPADWYVQLDCDEFFLEFPAFAAFLRSLPQRMDIQVIQCKWKTLFKQLSGGFLTIGGKMEQVPVAINNPVNTSERMNADANLLDTDFCILHQSWARSSREIQKKINNWSHSRDFDTSSFFSFWSALNKNNYKCIRHFHPIHPPNWPYLEWVSGETVKELINYYKMHQPKENVTPALPISKRLEKKLRSIFN